MEQIGPSTPSVISRARVAPVSRLRGTLREHYRAKREHYGVEYPDFYDRDLRRLFSDAPEHARMTAAAAFLNKIRPEIRRAVSSGTGQYRYTIDQVLKKMVNRCRELKLRVHRPEEALKLEAAAFLTVHIMNYLHSGKHRLAL